jgi:hypothetical protein
LSLGASDFQLGFQRGDSLHAGNAVEAHGDERKAKPNEQDSGEEVLLEECTCHVHTCHGTVDVLFGGLRYFDVFKFVEHSVV